MGIMGGGARLDIDEVPTRVRQGIEEILGAQVVESRRATRSSTATCGPTTSC
jgi:hypothetical protein